MAPLALCQAPLPPDALTPGSCLPYILNPCSLLPAPFSWCWLPPYLSFLLSFLELFPHPTLPSLTCTIPCELRLVPVFWTQDRNHIETQKASTNAEVQTTGVPRYFDSG